MHDKACKDELKTQNICVVVLLSSMKMSMLQVNLFDVLEHIIIAWWAVAIALLKLKYIGI